MSLAMHHCKKLGSVLIVLPGRMLLGPAKVFSSPAQLSQVPSASSCRANAPILNILVDPPLNSLKFIGVLLVFGAQNMITSYSLYFTKIKFHSCFSVLDYTCIAQNSSTLRTSTTAIIRQKRCLLFV